jgi:hypothetical protein
VRYASIPELQRLCKDRDRGCKVILGGGWDGLFAAKTIRFDTHTNTFQIYSQVDGHEQVLSPDALGKRTNLVEAISRGALGVEVRPNEPWCEHTRFIGGECPVCGIRREV